MKITVGVLKRIIRESLFEYSLKKNSEISLSASDPLSREIEDDAFDLVTKAYAPVGGNAKISSKKDIASEYEDWIVADVDEDPEIDIFLGSNKRHSGNKLGVSATDGSAEAKSFLMNIKKNVLNRDYWAEVSDAPAHIALNKLGIKPVESEDRVRELLDGKELTWHGEHPEGKFPGTFGWYTRKIGGTPHTKIIVGNVLQKCSLVQAGSILKANETCLYLDGSSCFRKVDLCKESSSQ